MRLSEERNGPPERATGSRWFLVRIVIAVALAIGAFVLWRGTEGEPAPSRAADGVASAASQGVGAPMDVGETSAGPAMRQRLDPGDGGLPVRVVHASTLAPVDGCLVVCENGSARTSATTAADGWCTISVPADGGADWSVRVDDVSLTGKPRRVSPRLDPITLSVWPASRRLTGVVTMGPDRTPASGANVRVELFGLEAIAGPDGRYELALPQAGPLVLVVSHAEARPEVRELSLDRAPDSLRLDVHLEQPPWTRVVVRDRADGRPLGGAQIEMASGERFVTGADGIVRARPRTPSVVSVRADGFLPLHELWRSDVSERVVELESAGTVRARVMDGSGRAVAGATCTVFDHSGFRAFTGRTDPDGRIVLQAIPNVEEGAALPAVVTVEKVGFGPRRVFVPAAAEDELTIVLQRGHAARARVVDERGRPLAGVRVAAFERTAEDEVLRRASVPVAVTDTAGRVTLRELAPGEVEFVASGEGIRTARGRSTLPSATELELVARARGFLSGVVSGWGPEVGEIVVRHADPVQRSFGAAGDAVVVFPDASGRWLLAVEDASPGDERLVSLSAPGRCLATVVRRVRLEPGGRPTHAERFELRAQRRLVGIVVDAGGGPVPAARLLRVHAGRVFGPSMETLTTTDGRGRYTFCEPLDEALVRVEASGFRSVVFDPRVDDRVVLTADLELGGVVRLASGAPAVGLRVRVQIPKTTMPGHFLKASTGAEGQFRFRELRAVPTRLRIVDPRTGMGLREVVAPWGRGEVPDVEHVEIRLEDGDASIVVTGCEPAAEFRAHAAPSDGGEFWLMPWWGARHVPGTGHVVAGLPAGRYIVVENTDRGPGWHKTCEVRSGERHVLVR